MSWEVGCHILQQIKCDSTPSEAFESDNLSKMQQLGFLSCICQWKSIESDHLRKRNSISVERIISPRLSVSVTIRATAITSNAVYAHMAFFVSNKYQFLDKERKIFPQVWLAENDRQRFLFESGLGKDNKEGREGGREHQNFRSKFFLKNCCFMSH